MLLQCSSQPPSAGRVRVSVKRYGGSNVCFTKFITPPTDRSATASMRFQKGLWAAMWEGLEKLPDRGDQGGESYHRVLSTSAVPTMVPLLQAEASKNPGSQWFWVRREPIFLSLSACPDAQISFLVPKREKTLSPCPRRQAASPSAGEKKGGASLSQGVLRTQLEAQCRGDPSSRLRSISVHTGNCQGGAEHAQGRGRRARAGTAGRGGVFWPQHV